MFATVNGIPTGFYTPAYHAGQPDYYPAGLSFKGDMTRMQVFAGIIAPDSGAVYGFTVIHNLTVMGELGVSSPLVADFSNPMNPVIGQTVQFTDTTYGGYIPYSAWSWDLNGDGIVDSTVQNPSYVYTSVGDYNVKLTVTGYCPYCGSATVTKRIHVSDPSVGGEWTPIETVHLVTPWVALAILAIGFAVAGSHRLLKKHL
jgi:PKD repeat protein